MTAIYAALPAMSDAIDAVYDIFGVDATYTACGGAGVAIKTVQVDSPTIWGEEIEVSNESIGVEMRRSEVAEKPRRGDTIKIGSTTYRFEQVLRSGTDLEWRALAVANGC